ncbi:hypothetical protein K503DRAFT_480580 [Rhizopogon vinicolor AM-OR11-026]|uniref:Uncharacterized protein n=1 Tax=Rhizopogon vinicolor AM-OR11-026 TaxID=1314800 RepID=A0A1B7MMX5_9AGAM|nr:hypothetical protein K503DRAFT_480580 [Rhizopogon vinicolor AM-OR11-026]
MLSRKVLCDCFVRPKFASFCYVSASRGSLLVCETFFVTFISSLVCAFYGGIDVFKYNKLWVGQCLQPTIFGCGLTS